MTEDAKNTAPNTSDGSWMVEMIVAGVVIYFARRAMPMLTYHDRLGVGESYGIAPMAFLSQPWRWS